MEKIVIQKYDEKDLSKMKDIWNEVVKSGDAFPQKELLTDESAKEFFNEQSYCAVAKIFNDDDAINTYEVAGLYILHPNGVGHLGHLCNASYAVKSAYRGRHIGKLLVENCLFEAKRLGYLILCFNAVVKNNIGARHLYEKLGFNLIGEIPRGFKKDDGTFFDICLYYINL